MKGAGLLNPLIASLSALSVSLVLGLGLSSIGILNLNLPLQDLMQDNGVSPPESFESLGIWFAVWNILTFPSLALQGVFIQSFDLSYFILLAIFLVSTITMGILASTKTKLLIAYLGYTVFGLLLALLAAFLTTNSLYIGGLPPSEQEETRAITTSLMTLSFLLPFYALVLPYITTSALGILSALGANRISPLKGKNTNRRKK